MILTVTLNAAIDKRYVVEGYQVGEVNRVKECAYTPGGKGLNVSKPASIAGAEVVATGFVGGHAGNYIEDALKPFGIKSEFYHLEEESRSCINIWDEVNHVQTEFLEPGFTVSEEEFKGFEKHFTELVKKADVVAMSGSVPKGLDGTAYQRLVRICKEAGKKVILDTSGKLLEMGIEAKPTMIKPNIDEIRMLTGKSCDNFQDMVDAASFVMKSNRVLQAALDSTGLVSVSTKDVYQNLEVSRYNETQVLQLTLSWNNADAGIRLMNAILDASRTILPETLMVGSVAVIDAPEAKYLMGGGSYAINGIPSGIEGLNPVELVRNMVHTAMEKGNDVKEEVQTILASTLARAAAIVYGQVLSNEEMSNLVDNLFACPSPNYTPDGKTVLATIKEDDIEKLFSK